jgi:hypothetical protein
VAGLCKISPKVTPELAAADTTAAKDGAKPYHGYYFLKF